MEISFDINEKIEMPEEIVIKKIDKYIIVLAPSFPNWIVLNKYEYALFEHLRNNNILDSLVYLKSEKNISEDTTMQILDSLLRKIVTSNFYKNTEIMQEEKMSKIVKNIHINLTNDCNLRCKHCYMSAGLYDKNQVDYTKLTKFLDNLYNINGSTSVVVSGGEPLLYNNLYDLLKYLKKQGHIITLFTNGILITDNNIKHIKSYVDEIQISMEGISKYYYEAIRGKGTYAKLLNSINLIKENNIDITLAITALDEVIDDIENEIINFLDDIALSKINVRINNEIEYKGNALTLNKSNFDSNFSSDNKINNIIKHLNKLGYTILYPAERNIHFSNCGIGTSIVINYDGRIYPCAEYDIDFFNLEDSPSDIVESFNLLNDSTGLDNMSCCIKCELRFICSGGCKIKNKLKYGSFTKFICDAKYKDAKYNQLLLDYLRGE